MDCKNVVVSGVTDVKVGALTDTLSSAVSLGLTNGGVTIATESTKTDVMVDQSVLPVRSIIVEQRVNLTIPLVEMSSDNILKAFAQVGTTASGKISMSPDVEHYYQVWIIAKGPIDEDSGQAKIRTYHFAKVSFGGSAELALSRTDAQTLTLEGTVVACPDANGNVVVGDVTDTVPETQTGD